MSINHRPPRFSAFLLGWLLRDDWHTPAGDFEEAFHRIASNEGAASATSWYRRQVLLLIPDRLKEKLIWNSFMFFNNLKISVRTLRKNPVFAAINMGGLAVGMAACLLIMLFVKDELTFDLNHSNSDQIVRVVEQSVGGDGSEEHYGYSRAALAHAAPDEIPEILSSAAMVGPNMLGRQAVSTEIERFYEHAYWFVKPSIFEIFDFEFIHGNPETALTEPRTLVLTRSAALRYFGAADPIGQVINFERQGDFQVTGVLADLPENSHFDFEMLLSWRSFDTMDGALDALESWDLSGAITYFLLAEGADIEAVESKVQNLLSASLPTDDQDQARPYLQPLKEVHFGSEHIVFEANAGEASVSSVWMFGLIAAFIILIAVINYTNMTTASSMKRAREIGMRKAVGANRSQVARQFFGESTVLVGLSLLSALLLTRLALPTFNVISGKSLQFVQVIDPAFLVALFVLALLVVFLSGFYPALFLSRFNPVSVLKGQMGAKPGAPRLQQTLVVAQFTLSIGLIISSLIVYQQMTFLQQADLGYDEDQLIAVDINDGNVRNNFRTITAEYASLSEVVDVSVSSNVPGDWKSITQIDVRAADSGDDVLTRSHFLGVDDRFVTTFNISLLEGRNLSMDTMADSMAVLVNEVAASTLGLEVGDQIHVPGSSLGRPWRDLSFEPTVVGIVDNFHSESLREPIGPMVMGFYTNPMDVIDYFTIRVAGSDLNGAVARLREVGERFDPGHPFEFNFLDERLQDFYQSEARMSNLFSLATSLAILIACLGLFGLTALTVARRTKEIGIRKVLGSSGQGIVQLLTREIVMLVAIAFVVAAPLSWFVMNTWLSGFAYRTEISIGMVLIAGAVSLVCALGTVSFQAFKAARLDPVKSLRYE